MSASRQVFMKNFLQSRLKYVTIEIANSQCNPQPLPPKTGLRRMNMAGEGGLIMDILKVSARSAPNSVAGAIAGVIREKGEVEVQAVGAGAANQAIKAIAIARGYLAPAGLDIICIPAFGNVEIDMVERTAIRLIVQPR